MNVCANCGRPLTRAGGRRWLMGWKFCLNQLACYDRARSRNMGKGWQTFVYQIDVDPEKFRGAFFDEEDANGWVSKQKEGTYEVSTEKPTVRTPRVDAGPKREAADGD